MGNFLTITTVPVPYLNKLAILIINFAVAALLFAVISQKKLKELNTKLFVGMSTFMLFWVNFAYLARLVGNGNVFLAEIFLRVAWVATPFLFLFTYLMSLSLLGKLEKYKKLTYVLAGLSLGASVLTATTKLIIEGIKFTGNNLDIQYGLFFIPFLLIIFLIIFFSLFPAYRNTKHKRQKTFLYGLVIFYVLNLIFNITLPLVFDITHLYYIGDYSTVGLLFFTTLAIIEYSLFNIKVVSTEALTIAIWLVLLANMLTNQQGSSIWVDLVVFAVMIFFGVLLVKSVIREVQQKEKLQELTQKLKDIDKQKDEFISMAAHEMRSPLTAIKGYTSMILEGDAGNITQKAKDYLADASAVTDRLIRLVNNMLNVTRIEEGRLVFLEEDVNVIKAAQEIFNSFRFEAERKGISFKLDVKDGVRDLIYGDPDKVREVLGNFVSNAIKFTNEGKVTIKITNPDKKSIKVEIIDTGPGITKEEQKKLFRKFYRAESTSGKTMGTGLGLYISKLLIERFSGNIGLESEFGKGSNFWFSIPLMVSA